MAPFADQAIEVRPRSFPLIAPPMVRRLNDWPPFVDWKNPLQFEPARQPMTASTTWPPVPGLTATSVTLTVSGVPPAAEQPLGLRTGVHAPEVVLAGCL